VFSIEGEAGRGIVDEVPRRRRTLRANGEDCPVNVFSVEEW
jgi:hypothetical protein